MSTPTEFQRVSAENDDLRAELALVSEQHAAACAKYEKIESDVYRLAGVYEGAADSIAITYQDAGARTRATASLRTMVRDLRLLAQGLL